MHAHFGQYYLANNTPKIMLWESGTGFPTSNLWSLINLPKLFAIIICIYFCHYYLQSKYNTCYSYHIFLKKYNHILVCMCAGIEPYPSFFYFFYFLKIDWLIDWLIAMLGLRFCARAFCCCGKQGPLFIAVRRPLTIVASLVAEHRLQTRRLSSCGSWA